MKRHEAIQEVRNLRKLKESYLTERKLTDNVKRNIKMIDVKINALRVVHNL